MADLMQAVDWATAPVKALSHSASGTRAALAKLSGRAS